MKATFSLSDSTVHSSITKARLGAVSTCQSRLPYTLAPKNNFEDNPTMWELINYYIIQRIRLNSTSGQNK